MDEEAIGGSSDGIAKSTTTVANLWSSRVGKGIANEGFDFSASKSNSSVKILLDDI